jgi:hypothetical protein
MARRTDIPPSVRARPRQLVHRPICWLRGHDWGDEGDDHETAETATAPSGCPGQASSDEGGSPALAVIWGWGRSRRVGERAGQAAPSTRLRRRSTLARP